MIKIDFFSFLPDSSFLQEEKKKKAIIIFVAFKVSLD